jgi:alanine-synthesizing transaminase
MSGIFSRRTRWDTAENSLAEAIRRARDNGRELVDLTISNPTVCGFRYDDEAVLDALRNCAAMTYDPSPRGILSAREAVARYYAEHGAEVDPGQIVLTVSTSEAYSFLFRLLCDPEDAVLVAQPSYPLFEFLADLDDVRLESYSLFYDFGWWIDFVDLERRIGPQTRALIVVHPNNPTGHATRPAERERLQELCARRGLVLIVDEVFLDYGLSGPVESFATGSHPCLTFVLSGLSKIAALPQMKVGWIGVFGPDEERLAALERLEIIADTFLSLNAPVQLALPEWLAGREVVAEQIRERVRVNLAVIDGALPVEAGWSAVVRLPQRVGSADLAARLVREIGVIVHPGSFYGIPQNNHVVVSSIGEVEVFRRGAEMLKEWCEPKELT